MSSRTPCDTQQNGVIETYMRIINKGMTALSVKNSLLVLMGATTAILICIAFPFAKMFMNFRSRSLSLATKVLLVASFDRCHPRLALRLHALLIQHLARLVKLTLFLSSGDLDELAQGDVVV